MYALKASQLDSDHDTQMLKRASYINQTIELSLLNKLHYLSLIAVTKSFMK